MMMRKEVKILRSKAIESLVLSIELFNRPSETGRAHGVLIFLDHAFEMLLKGIILHRGGRIREPRATQTIGFDASVRKGLSDAKVKFLTDHQALTVQMINSLRDAAQHHILDISEAHLYIQSQAGLSLFRDLFRTVFEEELQAHLPPRVLPLSTSPPTDLATLFDNETSDVRKLLAPGSRRRTEVDARLRSLAIVSGYGPSIDLRISKTGVPVQLVPEGTPGAAVVAVKRVEELGFYNLGRDQLAEKVGLTGPKTTAMIRFLKLKSDSDSYKEITIGKSKFDRYSQKAISTIKEALTQHDISEIWKTHGIR
jgi:hypothetical protein